MKSGIFEFINKTDSRLYIFSVTLFFYISLLILNPSNKFIAASFFPLFCIYLYKLKNLNISLFFVYVVSLVIETGKTYAVQLIPAGFFPIEIFPMGYFVKLVISPVHFISFGMLILLLRNILLKKIKLKINLIDALFTLFYFFKFLSAVIGSKEPGLSFAFELLGIPVFIAYFYARMLLNGKDILKFLPYIFASMIFLETVLGGMQLINKSPLYKNIEYQVNIEYFGNAVDESQFTFRPVGTFDHANSLGIWLASILLFISGMVVKGDDLFVFAFISGLAILITTLSRSAWLGFSLGFLFLNMNARQFFKDFVNILKKWKYIIFPVTLFAALFFIIPRAENSIYSFQLDAGGAFFRRIQILDALEVIKLYPIFGIGAAMSVYEGIHLDLYTLAASIPLQVHNWYIYKALENGLPAFFAILFFFLMSLKALLADKNNILNISIGASIVSALVAALLQPYINFEYLVLLLSLVNGANIKPLKSV